ncbi:MAG: hypothetical protein BWY82_01329 [Verrucomicrobia bacterium ADurb.Bin474]|nr:MAG: hypothetical protein BWY82_01329 [Verrucomicrobia bacterium ADurb.Bin474]
MRIVIGNNVDISTHRSMGSSSCKLRQLRFFSGCSLDHLRTTDEHIRILLGHDQEIHQRRRIGSSTGAGSCDDGDLGNQTGKLNIPEKDLSIAGKRVHAFLNPGTT